MNPQDPIESEENKKRFARIVASDASTEEIAALPGDAADPPDASPPTADA